MYEKVREINRVCNVIANKLEVQSDQRNAQRMLEFQEFMRSFTKHQRISLNPRGTETGTRFAVDFLAGIDRIIYVSSVFGARITGGRDRDSKRFEDS
jgi:hypothetical protein